MAWRRREIETILESRLQQEFGETGVEYYAHYVDARTKVVDNILPQIKAIEANLTDHSADHVGDVLDKAYRLIGGAEHKLETAELYFLCLIILFHDVGNIHGRRGHYDKRKIMEIYDFAVGTHSKYAEERRLVALAAGAHSGLATNGTGDTMAELGDQTVGVLDQPIDIRSIAPILRLADELAEGPHRTSDYMVMKGYFEAASTVYHEYAQITNVVIDRGNGRIALTYNINVECKDGQVPSSEVSRLEKLLTCAFHRVAKLNDERRYNKFYSVHLEPFTQTTVKFNFTINQAPIELGLNIIRITDLRVPGADSASIATHDPMYVVADIISEIKTRCPPATQTTA